jgi:hypothetical protein
MGAAFMIDRPTDRPTALPTYLADGLLAELLDGLVVQDAAVLHDAVVSLLFVWISTITEPAHTHISSSSSYHMNARTE